MKRRSCWDRERGYIRCKIVAFSPCPLSPQGMTFDPDILGSKVKFNIPLMCARWALFRGVRKMSYVFSRGLRLVVPYLDTCRVRVKAAWVGREIQQVGHIYITLTLLFLHATTRHQHSVVAFAHIRYVCTTLLSCLGCILWLAFTSHFILWPLIIPR